MVHGWVYGLHNGLVKDLNVTLANNEKLGEVYQLDID
jgi:carbonic anhydrase